jgi:FkbM family methyltransferase
VVSGPVVFPFANDTWLFFDRRGPEAAELRLLVLKDFEVMSFVAHFLRPGDHFIDVGAGIGSYAVLAAGVGGAHVTAFEPSDVVIAALHRNVGLNALQGSIDCLALALGDVAGPGRFVSEPGLAPRIVIDPCAEQMDVVPVCRLDDLISGEKRPCLLKIAASGDELRVLRGAYATLEGPGVEAVIVATEKLPWGAHARWHRICALLEKHGFVPAVYDPFRRRLLRDGERGRKCLFVREPSVEAISRRLGSARRFWAGSTLCV